MEPLQTHHKIGYCKLSATEVQQLAAQASNTWHYSSDRHTLCIIYRSIQIHMVICVPVRLAYFKSPVPVPMVIIIQDHANCYLTLHPPGCVINSGFEYLQGF